MSLTFISTDKWVCLYICIQKRRDDGEILSDSDEEQPRKKSKKKKGRDDDSDSGVSDEEGRKPRERKRKDRKYVVSPRTFYCDRFIHFYAFLFLYIS